MKKFFSKAKVAIMAAAAMLSICGCVNEFPSDITLDELEQKMSLAMDPKQTYRNAASYYQRQNIIEEGFFSVKHQLVEVKFQRPDKFKFSFYDKNRIATELLSVGDRAWMIDYNNATITELNGEALAKFKVMLALGHPDTDYDKLFAKVDLTIVEEEDQLFYKLRCQPYITGSNPIIILVNKETFMPSRMIIAINTRDGKIESINNIEEYQHFGDVYLPSLTLVQEGSREYKTRLVGYQLNAIFNEQEFVLPKFDPVLWEVKKRQRNQ